MIKLAGTAVLLTGLLGFAAGAHAQQTSVPQATDNQAPIYRAQFVSRTLTAVNYVNRGGSTKIDFTGTALLAKAHGEATVESKKGRTQISAKFDAMSSAMQFGPEYLTYVLWAITPEGRASNLGELVVGGDNAKINVTTALQSFGLIVTAEPYFAVTQPSDAVVLENTVRPDTIGQIEQVNAKYELLQRGQYVLTVDHSQLQPMRMDGRTPMDLYEARNAVQIARWAGADRYAADSLQRAQQELQQAEASNAGRRDKKGVVMAAREAVQTAEDARLIVVKKLQEENLATEQSNAARSNQERQAAEANAQAAQAQAQQAQTQTQQATADRAQAEAQRDVAVSQQQTAQADAERARLAQQQAEQGQQQAEAEKTQLRAQILAQLNAILETRETTRGLIVNMPDVLFDTGKFSLKPAARERLAKVAGIILAHPGLQLEIDGYTDSVGSDAFNRELSDKRAAAVRDYLHSQGVADTALMARGLGKDNPVADNGSASGRQQNRRVEVVVSGEVIGIAIVSTQTQ
jgi:outer membrane protein OmpA-like peptidoglycan-associated protein